MLSNIPSKDTYRFKGLCNFPPDIFPRSLPPGHFPSRTLIFPRTFLPRHFSLNPIRSGLFQTANDPEGGGALKPPPPYDLENYCVNLHHIIHVHFTRCVRHVPIRIFFFLNFDNFVTRSYCLFIVWGLIVELAHLAIIV